MANPFFGRVAPTADQFASICRSLLEAPRVSAGPPPRRSPMLWQYRLPRFRGQLIGCCVGESGASMVETTCRTPHPLPATVEPAGGAPAFSPLWVYHVARQWSRDKGRPINGEGAIVSDALQAVSARGAILYDAWPATPENYRRYSDQSPPVAAVNAPKIRPAGESRRLMSADAILEYLGQGYSVWLGLPWRGGNRTAPDGQFAWGGAAIGGHAVELLGYDLDLNAVWVGNSWDNVGWGFQPRDANAARGYGYCRWTDLASDLTPTAFSRGIVEAVVITEVDWASPAPPPPPPPPPVPTPEPTPGPSPNEGKGMVVLGGQTYSVTLRPINLSPSPMPLTQEIR